jgi:hypothetical protein
MASAFAQCGSGASTGVSAPAQPAASLAAGAVVQEGAIFKPVASVGHIMAAIIIPGSQAIFDAVVYVNGELTRSPKTDDDWFRIRMQALAVAEAGNLLLIPPRVRDREWPAFAQAMTEQAAVVANAAEAKQVDQLLEAGGNLYSTCTACHAKYLMEQP